MRFTIAMILLVATATTSLAQSAPPGGGVKRTAEGVCLEPGHPSYDTALAASTHPTMRECVLSGGRRDTLPSNTTGTTPTDPTGTTPTDPTGTTPTDPTGSAPTDPTGSAPNTTGLAPNPVGPATPGTQPTQPGLPQPYQTPPTEDTQTGQQRPKGQPGAPKGITLPVQPSYSEEPGLFRPPASYFGRGPENFEP